MNHYPSLRWSSESGWEASRECVAIEEPLAIEIRYPKGDYMVSKIVGMTMRTPTDDEALAAGFVFCEGLIRDREDIVQSFRGRVAGMPDTDVWCLDLAEAPDFKQGRVLQRQQVATSACGICSRGTMRGLPLFQSANRSRDGAHPCRFLAQVPELLRQHQLIFAETGGVHGAALFDEAGKFVMLQEDVGRHNAMDKLVGRALLSGVSLEGGVLGLSGRVSFELVQKAAIAGFQYVVAVGAPSSLAIDIAHLSDITLIGFTRGGRLNVYTHARRIEPAEMLCE